PRQLARACRKVEHPLAGLDAELADQRLDRLRRILGPPAFVRVGPRRKSLRRRLVDRHLRKGRGSYIRNTPNFVSGIGAWSAASRPMSSTRRVSSGSMIPSSHSRAVAK